MRVFLTGATGVIGRRVVPLLLSGGHEVTAVARTADKRAALERVGAKAVTIDLFDFEQVHNATANHDVVINLATHVPGSMMAVLMPGAWKENDRIRRDASAILSMNAGRFVQESFAIYADGGDRWLDEQAPVAPVPYNRSLLDAERSGAKGVVLRFAWFYGDDSPFTMQMANIARKNWSPVPGSPDAYFSSVSHDDAASAVVTALRLPGGIYNVTDDEPLTRRDFVMALGARDPKFGPPWTAKLMGSMGELMSRSVRLSNAKLKAASGWAPRYRSAREGLAFLHG